MRRRRDDSQYGLGLIAGALGAISLPWLARAGIGAVVRLGINIVSNDYYAENLWELVGSATRTGPHTLIENSLRAAKGRVIKRPLGTPKHYPGFNGLTFNFAQLRRLPTPLSVPVATGVIIGARAKKPLKLDTPIMVSGMAYGMSLSAAAKVAIARGTARAGTATNTGNGPWLPAERAAATRLVLQYSRGTWAKEPSILRQADMIEVQVGQGAFGGVGHKMPAARIGPVLRERLGLGPGQDAVIESRQPGVESERDLAALIARLRREAGGVPIAVKIAAGDDIEYDIGIIVRAGADVVVVDGAEGGSHGSPPILEDDFGLPTLYAVCRARRALDRLDPRRTVSLVVSGGLSTPGDFLKVMALGADAVAIGTVAMYAVTHSQITKAMPWEPPTQVVWYRGKQEKHFSIERGARDLARYLRSCTREMAEAVRALGKSSLAAVDRSDLAAIDDQTARITGLPLAYVPKPERPRQARRHP